MPHMKELGLAALINAGNLTHIGIVNVCKTQWMNEEGGGTLRSTVAQMIGSTRKEASASLR